MRRTHGLLLSLALAAFSAHLPAVANDKDDDKTPTLELNASASREVTLDTVTITMSYEHHGNSQTQVAQEVNARIASALAKAKQIKDVKTRTGPISTWSRYDKNRQPVQWTSRGSLTLESTNIEAASKLAGELSNTLTFDNSNFSLSREARNEIERELLQETAKAFRERSQEAAASLGFQRFAIKHVNLSGEGNVVPQRMARAAYAMAPAPSMKEDASPPPLQLEPGDITVTIGMHGRVYLLD